MIGENTPNISRLLKTGFSRPLHTIFPAVTCSVQATLLTGLLPSQHGIVANGWYFRDLAEVMFWKQSNHLISGERIYQSARLRNPEHTTAKMFWWYNMYADVNWSVTPRPSYPSDGRKIPDIYSAPAEFRDQLQQKLGKFPLFNFWGPTADIRSTAWIADASVDIFESCQPSLMLVYLPHLDYNLQRWGPTDPRISEDIRLVDHEAGKLIAAAEAADADIIVLSEYGITEVHRPMLAVRRESCGWETLDCGASRAFAVADHQAAHIYIKDPADIPRVRQLLERIEGVERVLDGEGQRLVGIAHERSGELVCISQPDSWFTYYFWMDDNLAPDYARTVDIHRKPGYDPVELLVDPLIKFPRIRVAQRLARKMLGFRYYMDLIGLDASIVKGSHGRVPDANRIEEDGPVLVCSSKRVERDELHATDVRNLLLDLQFGV
jgi:predicted AlkP superfamily pyrophosphatase or phosphodiesterase